MLHRNKKHTEAPLSERQRRIFNFLSETRVGVLSSIDPDGEPHGSVIYFILEDDFNIYFLTRSGTKKAGNLHANNHVNLTVFDAASQTVAQVVGKTHMISDNFEINRIAAAIFMVSISTSEGGVPPIAKIQDGEYVAYRIEPDQIRLASFVRPDPGDQDKLFESIESFELKT